MGACGGLLFSIIAMIFVLPVFVGMRTVNGERWTMSGELWAMSCELELKILFSRKYRQSRQRFRAKFREIREIITLVFSSDAARRRPYPLITQNSLLIAHRHTIKKWKALSPQSRGDSLQNKRRFIGKVKAIHRQSKGDSLHRLRQCGAWADAMRWLYPVTALAFWRIIE